MEATNGTTTAGISSGVEYNADLSESQYLVVPYKLYRLTEMTIWGDLWVISGLQFKYEAVSEIEGYAPILLTAGSTRSASRY